MRKATIYSLVVFLILIMASIPIRMGTYEILIKRLKMDNVVTRAVFFDTDEVFEEIKSDDNGRILFDTKKEYPFTKEKTVLMHEEKEEELGTNTTIEKVKRHINFFLSDRLLPYNTAVQLALMYGGYLGWNIHEDAVSVGRNYWVLLSHGKSPVNQVIVSISDFNLFLQAKNIPLLYVGIPDKFSPDDIMYNFVYQVNPNKNFIYQELRKLGIPVLDIRENIRAENKVWHSLFYDTDHHWKVETGFWASGIIAEKLNSDFGFDIDISLLNSQNYNHKTYNDWFLGSIGKKVGHKLAKPDNITLITSPRFETKIDILQFLNADGYNSYLIRKENVDFDSAFIHLKFVNKKDYYNLSPYVSYMGGDNCALIHNKLNSNGRKLLIIGDSNANVLVPFLSILVEYVVDIDLRWFGASLETLIEKEKPDIVIIAYNFLDNKKLFDFR